MTRGQFTKMLLASFFFLVASIVADKNSFRMSSDAINFSGCTPESDGRCCITTTKSYPTPKRQTVLECIHKNISSCHYTYITVFKPHQETVCSESYEKKCQITFHNKIVSEKVRKCYKPLKKVCSTSENSSESDEMCRTYHETSCTSRYVENVRHSSCSRIPRVLCGAQCRLEESDEECHEKDVDTVVDTPEEDCDLTPIKTCHLVTTLTPILAPKQKCTVIPQEVCTVRLSNPTVEDKPRVTKWCKETEDRKGKDFHENDSVKQRGKLQHRQNNVNKETLILRKVATSDVNPKHTNIQFSQLLPPHQAVRKTVGVASSFVFQLPSTPGNEDHQEEENIEEHSSQDISDTQTETSLARQPKEFKEVPSGDLSLEEVNKNDANENKLIYLPLPGKVFNQLDKDQSMKTAVNKINPTSPKPKSMSTVSSRNQPKSRDNQRKDKSYLTLSNLLPPPQIDKNKIKTSKQNHPNITVDSARFSQQSNAGQKQRQRQGKSFSHLFKLLPPSNSNKLHKNKIGLKNRNPQNINKKKNSQKTRTSQRQGKSYLPSTNHNKIQMGKSKEKESKEENDTKSQRHKSYLPKPQSKHKQYLPLSEDKATQINNIAKVADLPFYSLSLKFPQTLPASARPSPAGLAALAVFSQKSYEQYQEV